MSEKLEIMVIPFQNDRAVVMPKNAIEYVLPYARPLPSSYSHEALIGSIIYQNEKVPIVDLGLLCEDKDDLSDSGHRSLVIISSVNEQTHFNSYAIIANDAPRVFYITEETMTEQNKAVEAPFFSSIELDGMPDNELLVLDLESLENIIFEKE